MRKSLDRFRKVRDLENSIRYNMDIMKEFILISDCDVLGTGFYSPDIIYKEYEKKLIEIKLYLQECLAGTDIEFEEI